MTFRSEVEKILKLRIGLARYNAWNDTTQSKTDGELLLNDICAAAVEMGKRMPEVPPYHVNWTALKEYQNNIQAHIEQECKGE